MTSFHEFASARWMLTHAMRFLVMLLGGGPDNLDPLRRFTHDGIEAAMRRSMRRVRCWEIYAVSSRAVNAVRVAFGVR